MNRLRLAIATPVALCVLSALPAAVEAQATDDPGPDQVEVLLWLKAPGANGLERLARAVSDPTSPRYGDYLATRRTAARFGAPRATRRAVLRFLDAHGIRARIDVTRSFAQAFVAAGQAEDLFGPIGEGSSGNVPEPLHEQVRAVLQVGASDDQFLPGSKRADVSAAGPKAPLSPPYTRTGTPAGCEQGRNATFQPDDGPFTGPAFTPNQIRSAYGADRMRRHNVTGKGVRAAVLIPSFARPELRAFTECFGLRMPPTRLALIGRRQAAPTEPEGALDLQMLGLMAPGLHRLVVYSVGSGFFPVSFSSMLDARNAPDGHVPDVVSVSQGDCESDLGRAQVKLTDLVLASAAAAGITVAAGSGDSGSFCTSGRVGFYPGSSRWATSVGGTAMTLTDSNRIASQSAWNDSSLGVPFGGGGGFSGVLRAPFYQRRMHPWGDSRGYPDVSMAADGYPGIAIYCGLDAQGVCNPSAAANPFQALGSGTSAATPLFAGAVALADQQRDSRGQPRIGFANPLIYRQGRRGDGAVRDVVEGSNQVFPYGCCDAGPGYDLATGWGSIDASRLARGD